MKIDNLDAQDDAEQAEAYSYWMENPQLFEAALEAHETGEPIDCRFLARSENDQASE